MMKAFTPEREIEAAEYVRSHWRYDAETGQIHGRCDKPIGTLRKDGALHALVYLPGGVTSVLLHRAAWLLRAGEWPAFEIDHVDGVKSNNRWLNLRSATKAQNQQNRKPISKHGKLIGCTLRYNRWLAQIKHQGKVHYIGTFDTQQQAHEAYCAAKLKIHEFNPVQRPPPAVPSAR